MLTVRFGSEGPRLISQMVSLDYIYTSRCPYPGHGNGGEMASSSVLKAIRVLGYSLSYKICYDKKKSKCIVVKRETFWTKLQSKS